MIEKIIASFFGAFFGAFFAFIFLRLNELVTNIRKRHEIHERAVFKIQIEFSQILSNLELDSETINDIKSRFKENINIIENPDKGTRRIQLTHEVFKKYQLSTHIELDLLIPELINDVSLMRIKFNSFQSDIEALKELFNILNLDIKELSKSEIKSEQTLNSILNSLKNIVKVLDDVEQVTNGLIKNCIKIIATSQILTERYLKKVRWYNFILKVKSKKISDDDRKLIEGRMNNLPRHTI